MNRKIFIIGGGIGGLATAIALEKAGFKPTVFERAERLREVGAGLTLWSNAVKVLRWLGLEEQILAQSSEVKSMVTVDHRGGRLTETDLDLISQRAGAPSICVGRPELLRILVQSFDSSRVLLGHACVGFRQDASGVEVEFANGKREKCDLLIGADGIHSVIRAGLNGESPPRYAGYACWRGIANVKTYPVSESAVFFLLGSGSQIGLFPCGEEKIYWFATRNCARNEAEAPKESKDEILGFFREWHHRVNDVIEATPETEIVKNAIIDRPPCHTWAKGRVALLGDAVHATTPNLGQGACQALEDAVMLAESLSRNSDIETSIRRYETSRARRAAMVIQESWALGKVLQWQSPPAVWFRNAVLKLKLNKHRETKVFSELLSHDPLQFERLGADREGV